MKTMLAVDSFAYLSTTFLLVIKDLPLKLGYFFMPCSYFLIYLLRMWKEGFVLKALSSTSNLGWDR